MDLQCPHCKRTLRLAQPYPYHAGFGDQGFLYCESDPTIVTFGAYGHPYRQLVGAVLPWDLDADQRRRVEEALLPCPCGGRFTFRAEPRCPSCGASLRNALPGDIYYVILGRHVDGEREMIWKS